MPNDPFYSSKAWRKVRALVRKRDRQCCTKCGVSVRARGSGLVDHIKDRKQYPQLALFPPNLRTLCWSCHNARHADLRTGRPERPVIGADGFPIGSAWSDLSKRDDDT
ncbi:HNH endonuclease [Ruegeria conchae]|uniref:HNH endonuclease n=1 Tax=Ruegeria conchae TaxID=981384 RepID=UPI0021A962F7|nr:HNH endonuclease [Ruegeria conchae]UWR04737.1 HNH endonuclease [Ruegeria conchae]